MTRIRKKEDRVGPGLIQDSADGIEGKSVPPANGERRRMFEAARGAWSDETAGEWRRDVREAWSSRQTAPS